MIPFESFAAYQVNEEIFELLQRESLRASQHMAKYLGEPEYCRGYGVRNTHRLAVAPNTTSSQIGGGVSQGIEPYVGVAYKQRLANGDVFRVSPQFMELAKSRGQWSEELIHDIMVNHKGSVQHLTWLTEHEKLVFKTFREIDQHHVVRQANQRGRYICQGQSLNTSFKADASEQYMSSVHVMAAKSKYVKAMYYMNTESGVDASKGACEPCGG